MHTCRNTAVAVGLLFIICTISSIAGGALLNPLLDGSHYLGKLASNSNRVFAGGLIEFIWAITGAGIAIALYPILKKQNGAMALGAVGFRLVEGIFVLAGSISLLALLTLSRELNSAGAAATATYQVSGSALLALRNWAHNSFGLIAFSLGTLLYSAVLYRSRLIPRWLSVWGFSGAALCLGVTLYGTFNSSFSFTTLNTVLNAPIGLQEMVLAGWLIVKGFNPPAVAALSTKTP